MSSVFIFHGTGGTPEENWFPWLKKELEQIGHTVTVPAFPDTYHPNLETWLATIKNEMSEMNEETILVGHSIGATLILRILERLRNPIRSCFLVAPVSEKIGDEWDTLFSGFIDPPFDWDRIKTNAQKREILHANNDPYIPLSHARTLANHIGAELTVISGGRHLNQAAGFTEFPLLRNRIFQ